jgi:hypothetical protein
MDKQEVIEGFGKVLKELGDLQAAKVEEYGIKRYEERDPNRAMMMVYNDVYRKYIRLEHQVMDHILTKDRPVDTVAIRESCRDLANYAGMGVQMVDILNHGYAERFRPQYQVEIVPIKNDPPPPPLFGIEQIALVNPPGLGLMSVLKILGATHWSEDHVTTRARVWGGPVVEQRAHLAFNYQLIPGKELELIKYESGSNWLDKAQVGAGLSHMGLHVENIEEATAKLEDSAHAEVAIAQDAVTIAHTNPAIKDSRRYRYRIFNTRQWLGFDLKFIQRHIITPGVRSVGWWGYDEPDGSWLRVELP